MPLDFPSNPNTNDTYTSSSGTTWMFDGIAWNVLTSQTIINIPSNNSFQNVSVDGQTTVSADSPTDTLTLVAGSNITITTNASQDSVTINSTASGGGQASDSFTTISVSGQDSIIADSPTDTLTINPGSGITITTNSATNTVTVSSSLSVVEQFNQLTDVTTAALTVDEIYLPAITKLVVTNNGATAYIFDQYTGNNPPIYAINGTTIAFKLNATGHPFLVQTGAGVNYDNGLVHVSTNGTVSTGSSAQGKDSGTLYWKIPSTISGNYRYQCSAHAAMVGVISIKNFGSI